MELLLITLSIGVGAALVRSIADRRANAPRRFEASSTPAKAIDSWLMQER